MRVTNPEKEQKGKTLSPRALWKRTTTRSQPVWKQEDYKVKMVADPDPLSRVLHDRSQRAIPVCERGNLSNAGQAVSRSKSRIP
jgi:hypothetical protein